MSSLLSTFAKFDYSLKIMLTVWIFRAHARLPEIVAPLLHSLSHFTGMSLVLLGGAPPRDGVKEGYTMVE